jgi:hypothetical protein
MGYRVIEVALVEIHARPFGENLTVRFAFAVVGSERSIVAIIGHG